MLAPAGGPSGAAGGGDGLGLHLGAADLDHHVVLQNAALVGGAAGAATRAEPTGFFRKGAVGSWRGEWSLRDRQAFAEEAGALLVELGYEPDVSVDEGLRRLIESLKA